MAMYKVSYFANGVLVYSDRVMLTPEQKNRLEYDNEVVIVKE